jgi:LysM repeat protein
VLSANYPAAAVINGDRKGLNWRAGGGWNDGTPNATPDWIEVDFPGQKLVDEVDLFSMQDNYSAPVEPTPTMTFNYYGVRGFEVQYWTGTAWAVVPAGVVTNNSLVWRQVVFGAVTTSMIRINVTQETSVSARVMELEAWGVSAAGNVAPTVSIASPVNGAQFTTPADITISATAADSDGTVQRVDFFVNGSPVGSDASSPFSVAWNGVTSGSYSLTAVATDNNGAQTTSAAVQVNVLASNAAPSIAIVNPAEGASFTAPAAINIDASASDSDGTIQQVTFFVNGSPIATDASSPFGITWTNVAMGSYTLTAVATDNIGATATSAPVHIIVKGDSLDKIAKQHGVTITELQKLNKISDPKKLQIGQQLVLPPTADKAEKKEQ